MGIVVTAIGRLAKAVGLFAAWLGVVFIAKDAQEIPQAIEAWGVPVVIPDRETILIVFSGLLVAWIVWRDLRPLLQERFPRIFGGALSIEFDPENSGGRYWAETQKRNGDGYLIRGTEYRVRIVNNTNRTLRNVRSEMFHEASGSSSQVEFARDGSRQIDIGPRSYEFATLFLMLPDQDTDASMVLVRVASADDPEVEKKFFLRPGRVPLLSNNP